MLTRMAMNFDGVSETQSEYYADEYEYEYEHEHEHEHEYEHEHEHE